MIYFCDGKCLDQNTDTIPLPARVIRNNGYLNGESIIRYLISEWLHLMIAYVSGYRGGTYQILNLHLMD